MMDKRLTITTIFCFFLAIGIVILFNQPPSKHLRDPGFLSNQAPTFMKIFFAFILSSFLFFSSAAQPRIQARKYPSLLWEITGNGLKKPSHIIGTMHVSSKMAFNLPDSFYIAIRNAKVVALESNPETWQEDMSKYEFSEPDYEPASFSSTYSNYTSVPNDYFSIKTLKFFKYDTKVERALYSSPASINNLLYRSYGNETSDFEEDTYLDMYIFQCGKKWNKKVTGVEDYGESMRLMMEAYRDAAKDKNTKRRSYTDSDNEYSADKLEEAYRTGNLDMLDSINKYNSVSAAFDEKFLYRRNEIQAASIDSILRSGSTLFVGVGAAHLPGERGVIEILRSKGYKLRPVKMGERASHEKELVDRIRVPVLFHTESAKDGMFRVDIPGKFYQFGDEPGLDQQQYADMSNGSYYMVTRIMTNAWMWNQKPADVYRTIDSLLYENIPGKIVSKTTITKNGYSGFDIVNRTRRGDIQRYNIFITPFEVILFKMGGNGEYVRTGTEASRFFGSIQLKEFAKSTVPAITSWKKYSPPYGGFSVNFPHDPYVGNDGSWIFDAADSHSNEHYRIMRTDIHNYHFVEEDSFDLGLMEESFSSSGFISEELARRQGRYNGYPSMDAKYLDKTGNIYLVRFIIEGPHYYTLIAHGSKETAAMNGFLNSFRFQSLVYGASKLKKDSSLYYSVTTPVYPKEEKIKISIPTYGFSIPGEELSENEQLEEGIFRNQTISNDSTGEKVFITFFRSPRYYYSKDSSMLEKDNVRSLFGSDSSWVVKKSRKSELPGKSMKVWEMVLSDSNSSRALWGKSFYKDGVGFSIATQIDTLTTPSPFLKQFFESFTPVDSIKGINPFEKKSGLFFSDLMSSDSTIHQRAAKSVGEIDIDDTDLPMLSRAIESLNWKEKKYLDTKTALINKLGGITTPAASDYLKKLYYALEDTIELQYAVLENLLQHKTAYAWNIFRDIIRNEPPVLQAGTNNYSDYVTTYLPENYDDGKFLDELTDSLQLTKTILPDLLPLLNLEDYKSSILKLLGQMVDSNLVTSGDYDAYSARFLLEARQELKKQLIAEKKKAIQKAEDDKEEKKSLYNSYEEDEKDAGNDDLNLYATVLLPYWDKNPSVPALVGQMLKSVDRRLKYNTLMLLIRKNKPYPDSLLDYFAGMDDYRYELYNDLKMAGKSERFPSRYNTHEELGISALLDKKTYGKPDSLVYLDRLKTTFKNKTGYLYFYKYKEKKDDMTWRIAVAGMVPEDPRRFEIEDSLQANPPFFQSPLFPAGTYNRYSFTNFSDIKLNNEEPIALQLKKMQKRLLYSRRKSGKAFYDDEKDGSEHID